MLMRIIEAVKNLLSKPTKSTGKTSFGYILLLVLIFIIPQAAYSQTINKQLDSIIKRELPADCYITIQIVDLGTGKIIGEKNPDQPLIPASTMKVVTSAAALQALNPEFTFLTEVYADGIREHSIGNIYLKGYGDPYMVSEELFARTRELRDKGLKEIRGDLIMDDSYFEPEKPLDENEKLGSRAYHAPYSALSLNFNSIKIIATPAARAGEPATLMVDPPSAYAQVKGNVKTVRGNKPAQLEITKDNDAGRREVMQVEGSIGVEAPSKGRYANVSQPALYTGEVWKEFLLREGIKVSGRVIRGRVPASAVRYHEFNSRPLGSLVYWMNKFSSNFMAEQISLAMGAFVHGSPGTREKGLAVIREHLVSCGVDEKLFTLSEASGLSRNNHLSASALVRVLFNAARDFAFGPEYMASFGISGVDGTLKEKFTDPDARRRLRAKTGTLRGVNALAGYGTSVEGRLFAFAVLVNSQKPNGLIDHGDKIMRAVLDMPMDFSGN